MLLMRKGL
nr:unnamed protein product [Callosobruchus chinensis]